MTKGENLTVQLDTNDERFVEYKLHGKDLVITVYNHATNHEAANINGRLIFKGYASVDKLGNGTLEIIKANGQEIADLKEKNRWFARAITGAVITALIGLLFVYLKIGLGVN